MLPSNKRDSALVMLSGGLDSTVALYWALSKNLVVSTITFDYFRRTTKERQAALSLAESMSLKNYTVNVRFLREIDEQRNSKVGNRKLASAPEGYIPSRNIIFYGIAASLSETSGISFIVGGHNRDDKLMFKDSSQKFFQLFNKLTETGLYTGSSTGRVILPLANMTKTEVVKLGSRLGVPFRKTWSCYKSGMVPCRKCNACLLRASAFKEAMIVDPLLS